MELELEKVNEELIDECYDSFKYQIENGSAFKDDEISVVFFCGPPPPIECHKSNYNYKKKPQTVVVVSFLLYAIYNCINEEKPKQQHHNDEPPLSRMQRMNISSSEDENGKRSPCSRGSRCDKQTITSCGSSTF